VHDKTLQCYCDYLKHDKKLTAELKKKVAVSYTVPVKKDKKEREEKEK
jgi:hypothetical protein